MEKVNNLIHSLFNPHTFLREVPSSLSRVLTPDDVGGKTWKKLTARAEEVRNRLRSHKRSRSMRGPFETRARRTSKCCPARSA